MLLVEPEQLQFNNVRLNQAYTTSLCITNNSDSSLECSFRATSPRYSVSPNRVRLDAGKSIVVTVRLFVSQAHGAASSTGPQKNDFLVLKCLYSEQRVPVSYTLFKKAPGSTSRSPSPSRGSRSPNRGTRPRDEDAVEDVFTPKRSPLSHTKEPISPKMKTTPVLAVGEHKSNEKSNSPPRSHAKLNPKPSGDDDVVPRSEYNRICNALEQERLLFEQKSEKVIRVLERKDAFIQELKNQLAASGRGDFESSLQYPAGKVPSDEEATKEIVGLRERVMDQSEQIEVLISEIARLRNELAENTPLVSQQHSPQSGSANQPEGEVQRSDDRAGGIVDSHSAEELVATKKKVAELEAQLFTERYKCESLIREMEDVKDRNRYLENELTAISSQFQKQQEEYLNLSNRDLKSRMHIDAVGGDGDPHNTAAVGPEVFSLYQERANRAEAENGYLRDQVAVLQRENTELENRFIQNTQLLRDNERHSAELAEKCAELEAIVNVSRISPQSNNPDRDVTDKSPPNSRVVESLDGDRDLKEANVWWSYVWHAMSKSDDARLHREKEAAQNLLATTDHEPGRDGADGSGGAPASSSYYTDVIARLHRSVSDLKSNCNEQVIEIANARQNLLSNRLKHRAEVDALREELDISRRDLQRALAREKAHKGDGEIKISELTNSVRMLSGKSDAHAIAAAARQELLAEKLTVHHLRADVEAYRTLISAEQARISTLKRDLETTKSLLDSSSVLETVQCIPGVSAQLVIEAFADKMQQLEQKLANSRSEMTKLKLKLGSVSSDQEYIRSHVPTAGARLPSILARSMDDADVLRSSKRSGSISPIISRTSQRTKVGGKKLSSSANNVFGELPVNMRSGAEFRVRANMQGAADPDLSVDGEIYVPPSIEVTGKVPIAGDSVREGNYIWEALAPCIQVHSAESLLDSLNSALMARQLVLQASQIKELEEKLEVLESEKNRVMFERVKLDAEETDRTRIDLDTCQRRLELSEATQKLVTEDLNIAREKILALEKEAVQFRIFNSGSDSRARSVDKQPRFYGDNSDSDDELDKSTDITSSEDVEHHLNSSDDSADRHHYKNTDHKKEMKRLKACEKELRENRELLRERTTQLRILMQTVEAVQHSSLAEGESSRQDTKAFYDLEDLAQAPLGSLPESTNQQREIRNSLPVTSGFQALIKRVVELTTEISSETAANALLSKRYSELELENRKAANRLNKAKAKIQKMSLDYESHIAENKSLKQQLRHIEYDMLEHNNNAKSECDRLLTALRESESEIEGLRLSLDNVTKQMNASDHKGFIRWIEEVVLNDDQAAMKVTQKILPKRQAQDKYSVDDIDTGADQALSKDTTESEPNSVKGLVVALLVQWREQAGFYPRGATGPISKAEQRFLQRITDLVLSAHERCEGAIVKARQFEEETRVIECKNDLLKRRLALCTQQLHRYLRRTDFSERVISIDRKHAIRANERLLGLYRNDHVDIIRRAVDKERHLYLERCKLYKVIEERDVLHSQNKQLLCRLAELESHAGGSMSIRIREQVASTVQNRVQNIEDTLHKWFKVELPRLLSGMPINEDDMSMRGWYTDNIDYPLDPTIAAASSEYLMDTQGKMYTLTQALCSSKAMQAACEFKASGLTERNSVLKDRIIELEGVILRWRDQIERKSSTVDSIRQQLFSSHADEPNDDRNFSNSSMSTELSELRKKYVASQEEVLTLKSQLEQCQERNEAMRKLAEHFRKEEMEDRSYTAHQLNQLRLNLEEEHAKELRSLRQSYEAEKENLSNELAMVADAIRQEVNADVRVYHQSSELFNTGTSNARSDEYYTKMDQDIEQKKRKLLHSLNEGVPAPKITQATESVEPNPSVIPSGGPVISSEHSSQCDPKQDDLDSLSNKTMSDVGTEPEAKRKNSNALKKSQRVESLTKQLADTTRQLSQMQKMHASAQSQILELEELLETQRDTFQLNTNINNRKVGMNRNENSEKTFSSADAQIQTQEVRYETGESQSIPIAGDVKGTIDSISDDVIGKLKDLYSRQSAWMQALETAAFLQQDSSAVKVSSSADAAMVASEFSSQIRILTALVEKIKFKNRSQSYEKAAEETIIKPSFTSVPQSQDGEGEHVTNELHRLAGRVRDIENIFCDNTFLPEQHLMLLRELRVRCSGLENLYNDELSRVRREWNEEREMLHTQINNLENALKEDREESSRQASILRDRYEAALKEVQEAMELQTISTGDQLSHLQDILETERQKYLDALASKEKLEAEAKQGDAKLGHEMEAEEISRLKHLLADADAKVEQSKHELMGLRNEHAAEMENLRDHFRKFRVAQQEVISVLETQLSDIHNGDSGLDELSDLAADHTYVSYEQEFGAGISTQEAQLQMNKLAARHRLKRLELAAILKAISSAGASVSSDDRSYAAAISLPSINLPANIQTAGQAAMSQGKDIDGWSMGAATRIIPLREELLEARVTAADKEMESLQEIIERERRTNAALRMQLNSTTGGKAVEESQREEDGDDSSPDFILPSNILNDLSESNKKLLSNFTRRVNSFKRSSKEQLNRLKNELKALQGVTAREDVNKLKTQVTELKTELNSLREENARKSKLLSTFKATRSADFNAIEQWRHEAEEMEDKLKHLKSAIVSKDSIIKDLKNKLSSVESTADESNANANGDYASMSAVELKNRLKSADLEVKRLKMRVTAFREKMTDLERVVEPLKAENSKLKNVAEKIEAMKASIARKDTLLKNYRDQAERSKSDFEALKEVSDARRVDMDKKIKVLQRQLDETQESYHALKEEHESVKQRLLATAANASKLSIKGMKSIVGNESRHDMLRSVPTGDFVHPHEAAVPPILQKDIGPSPSNPPRHHSSNTAGYLAPTVSRVNQMKSVNPTTSLPAMSQSSIPSTEAAGPANVSTFKEVASWDLLTKDDVPESVNIALSDLNDIVGAVGGARSFRNRISGHELSSSSSDLLSRPPPGSIPVGPALIPRGADSSSDSSTLSVERRLQQLVDAALLPEPPARAPPSMAMEFSSFADLSDGNDDANNGTRMSGRRKSTIITDL